MQDVRSRACALCFCPSNTSRMSPAVDRTVERPVLGTLPYFRSRRSATVRQKAGLVT